MFVKFDRAIQTQHRLGLGGVPYLQHQLHTTHYTRKLVYELTTKSAKPITTTISILQKTHSQLRENKRITLTIN